MNNVHLPAPRALNRFLLALGTYLAALLLAWAVTEAPDVPSPSEAAMLVVMFPVGLAVLGNLVAWLMPPPDVPLVLAWLLYPAFALALTLARHARLFWRIYAVFAAVLALNVVGCAMIVPR